MVLVHVVGRTDTVVLHTQFQSFLRQIFERHTIIFSRIIDEAADSPRFACRQSLST